MDNVMFFFTGYVDTVAARRFSVVRRLTSLLLGVLS